MVSAEAGVVVSKRHFGYVLPKNGGHFDALRFDAEVPTDTYQEFLEMIAVTSELRPFVIDYMGLEANFQSFERIEDDIRTDYETMENPLIGGALTQTSKFWKTQSTLSNFLCSASAFRDRSQTRLRERYGKTSSQYTVIDNAITAAYDSAIEYRLFYNLRNYAQHHDIPFSHIPVNATRHVETGKVEETVAIVLKPSALTSSSLIQKSFVRNDLAKMTDDIDLSKFARVYMKLHAGFMRKIVDLQAQRLAEMHQYEAVVMKQLKVPPGAYPVIWEGGIATAENESINAKFSYFSFDELDLIKVLYERAVALSD